MLHDVSNQLSQEYCDSKRVSFSEAKKQKSLFRSRSGCQEIQKSSLPKRNPEEERKWFLNCEASGNGGNANATNNTISESDSIYDEYQTEIFEYLYYSEEGKSIDSNYMSKIQSDITPGMRSVLVDWLVEVAQEYNLCTETLFLSVIYIDRCLGKIKINRNQLQLIGITSLFIASKYEEIYAPTIEDFCYITDSTYNREEVLQMERKLLEILSFELTQPTIKTFLTKMLEETGATVKVKMLAVFLAELTLTEYKFLCFRPSMIATSAVILSFITIKKVKNASQVVGNWSRYTLCELRSCIELLNVVFTSESGPAVREKYSQQKYNSVALVTPLEKLSWE